MFGPQIEADARSHAAGAWPREACGIISGNKYVPLANEAEDPREAFRLPAATFRDHQVDAVVHSHCSDRHLPWPTKADMEGQLATAVPWGIVWTNGTDARGPLWFGDCDFLLEEPLVGREFQPGVRDCYSLVRGWYWQTHQLRLKEFPRDADWWTAGDDLIRQGFAPAGFRPVDGPRRQGDVVLMRIRARVPNHCGIVLENGLVLHHLGNRLSRREPLGPWLRYVDATVRFGG